MNSLCLLFIKQFRKKIRANERRPASSLNQWQKSSCCQLAGQCLPHTALNGVTLKPHFPIVEIFLVPCLAVSLGHTTKVMADTLPVANTQKNGLCLFSFGSFIPGLRILLLTVHEFSTCAQAEPCRHAHTILPQWGFPSSGEQMSKLVQCSDRKACM